MRGRSDLPRDTAISIGFTEAGLVLGMNSLLVRMGENASGRRHLDTKADRERALALLSVVAKRSVGAEALAHVEDAADHWHRGDKALANLRLIFANLPRLEDPSDAYRLYLAEHLLDNGMTPGDLMDELGLGTSLRAAYSPAQPRVPAGNGRISGEWLRVLGAAATFLADAAPEVVVGLAGFASRFSTPTAVLGALFIPTPNSGGVTEGMLPDAPDVSFRKDGAAGTLRLTTKAVDGSDIVVAAQNRGGVYYDIRTGDAIGRDFGDQFYLDFDAIDDALDAESDRSGKPRPDPGPAIDNDEPKMCPAPTPDVEHGSRGQEFEELVHARVNPLAPLPRGFGVNAIDPLTGQPVYLDDCFRYAGDLVDGDMHAGDLVEAKGIVEFLLRGYVANTEMADEVAQAEKELRVADARGVRLKWYFAEEGAAQLMRQEFQKHNELQRIVVGHLNWRPRR